jgi:hypothetical protein
VLTDVSALLTLLVEGGPNATVTNLLAAPTKRDAALNIWNGWKPYLSHHPKFPIAEPQVKKEILKIQATAYASPLARDDAAEYLRKYAESALTSAAFTEIAVFPEADDMPLVRPPPPARSS